MFYGDNWDPSNDWSLQGIKKLGEEYDTLVSGVEVAERCPNVCVYANGKLVGGTEPDGTTPERMYTKAHLDRLRKCLLSIKPFDNEETAMQFDFNNDGKIDVRDETMLKRMINS